MDASEIKELLGAIRNLEKSTSIEFAKIGQKLEQLHKSQEELKEDIEKFKDILNDPNDGLYKRLNDIVYDIKNLSVEQDECVETIHEIEKKVNENNIIKENLIKIAGERLENLDSTIKTNKNSNKILWTFIMAAVAMAGERIIEILKLF